jgi:hypothetical protein
MTNCHNTQPTLGAAVEAEPIKLTSKDELARRGCLITSKSRTLAQVEADEFANLRRKITRQEDVECRRQARIGRARSRRKAKFIMPLPAVSAAARTGRARLMARR